MIAKRFVLIFCAIAIVECGIVLRTDPHDSITVYKNQQVHMYIDGSHNHYAASTDNNWKPMIDEAKYYLNQWIIGNYYPNEYSRSNTATVPSTPKPPVTQPTPSSENIPETTEVVPQKRSPTSKKCVQTALNLDISQKDLWKIPEDSGMDYAIKIHS